MEPAAVMPGSFGPQKRLATQETSCSPENKKEAASTSKQPAGFTLRLLYLFAGAERKTSVVSYLRTMVEKEGWELEAVEVDLKRGDQNDLRQEAGFDV